VDHDAKDEFAFPSARGGGDFGLEAFPGGAKKLEQCSE